MERVVIVRLGAGVCAMIGAGVVISIKEMNTDTRVSSVTNNGNSESASLSRMLGSQGRKTNSSESQEMTMEILDPSWIFSPI